MAGMGPPPKDPSKRARGNATVHMTPLPATGRTGRVPAWPLPVDVQLTTRLKVTRARIKDLVIVIDDPAHTVKKRAELDQLLASLLESAALIDAQLREQRKYEKTLWAALWKTPMAVEWERLAWTREVALYVRWQVRAELGDIKCAGEARLRAETLGLTPMSLLRLRWRVTDESAAAAAPRAAGSRTRYAHLRAVGDTST